MTGHNPSEGDIVIGANGQTVELLTIGGRSVEVDAEIAPIVAAMNAAGAGTRASCSGHGYRPGTIILNDGRWLIIANEEQAKTINAVFPLDINGNTIR